MKVARTPPLATRSARKPRRLRLMRSSWIKLVGIAIDPRARDVGAVISVSDFDAKRGFMVRSEGGRICCKINGLLGSFKAQGAFRSQSIFEEVPEQRRFESCRVPKKSPCPPLELSDFAVSVQF
jgi:hypothetical protein